MSTHRGGVAAALALAAAVATGGGCATGGAPSGGGAGADGYTDEVFALLGLEATTLERHEESVVTYRIDLDDPAGPSATLVREIVHPEGRTSQQVGSAQVTSDGSVLVDWGATQPIFVEYGQDDTELFRIELPSRDQAYRITKYGIERFDADELRATAGGAIEPPL